jgi:hypothetical protein
MSCIALSSSVERLAEVKKETTTGGGVKRYTVQCATCQGLGEEEKPEEGDEREKQEREPSSFVRM